MTETYNYRIWIDRYLGISSDVGTFKVLLALLLALSIVDAAVSFIGVAWLGATEGNPLFCLMGVEYAMVIKVIGGAVLIGGAWLTVHTPKPLVLHTVCFLVIMYGVVTISNIIQLSGGI